MWGRVLCALAAASVTLAAASTAASGPVDRFRDGVRGKPTLVVAFHPY
jgi:hypothetical protein